MATEVEADFTLPLTGKHDVAISWESDGEAITIDGEKATVHRQDEDVTVKLTATLTLGDVTESRDFNVVVKAKEKPGTDYKKLVAEAKEELEIATEVEGNFLLPLKGKHYVAITWKSDNEAITINGHQATVTRQEEDVTVTLTATLALYDVTDTKTFNVVVKAKEETVPLPKDVTVTFNVIIPSNTPIDEDVFIAGDLKKAGIPQWNPSSELCKATRVSLTEVKFEIVYEDFEGPITIEYKWTRGSWTTVEKGKDNEELSNRRVTIDGTEANVIINDTVLKWADLEFPVELTDEDKVDAAYAALELEALTVDADFELPLAGEFDTVITWSSENTEIISINDNLAVVTRPEETTKVKLIAKIKLNEVEKTKEFLVTVLGTVQSQDELDVLAAAEALTVTGLSNMTADKVLPHEGINGTTITWTSSKPESISIEVDEAGVVTAVVHRLDEPVSNIELIATITKNDATTTKKFIASVRASAFTVTVTWHITIPEPLPNAVVITTGSSHNSWNPGNLDYGVATKLSDTVYEFKKEFHSPNGTDINLQYKWTLQVPGAGFAPWSGEELTLSGTPTNNRTLKITRNTTEVIEDVVLRWRVPVPTEQQSTVVGNLEIVELTDERLPAQFQTRKVRIWTPEDYDPEDTTKTYPVIYVHDGQNVFDAVTSYAGEWNADETVTALMKVGGFGGAIVVDIDNTLDRLAEYTYDYEWLAGSRRGNAYMDFVVEVVKAYVDENYNTKPERENTMLLGSSMGGLITFFGGLNHLDTFGMLVPFSTSTQRVSSPATNIPALLEALDSTLLQNTRFFLYVGTNSDGDSTWPEKYRGYLEGAGVPSENIMTYQGVGYTHNEYAWSTHLPLAIEWAFDLEVNKTALIDLVDGLTFVEEDYSENSWNVFVQAKAFAQDVIADDDAKMTDIVNAYGELTRAISQLVLLEDMEAASLVDDLIIVLPTIADFDETHMDAFNQAKAAYNLLTDAQKSLVKFYYVIDLIQKKIDEQMTE